jgi:hypothetical protein
MLPLRTAPFFLQSRRHEPLKGSGQIGVKMYDKRGGSPPEPVIVNSSSGICSRLSVRNMQEPLSELCMGVRKDSNMNRIAYSVHGLSKTIAYS